MGKFGLDRFQGIATLQGEVGSAQCSVTCDLFLALHAPNSTSVAAEHSQGWSLVGTQWIHSGRTFSWVFQPQWFRYRFQIAGHFDKIAWEIGRDFATSSKAICDMCRTGCVAQYFPIAGRGATTCFCAGGGVDGTCVWGKCCSLLLQPRGRGGLGSFVAPRSGGHSFGCTGRYSSPRAKNHTCLKLG